jgi:hypothetical protein
MMIDRPFIAKLICIGLVAAVMLPLGGLVFPYFSGELSRTQFQAVFSATAGFGIYGFFA